MVVRTTADGEPEDTQGIDQIGKLPVTKVAGFLF